MNKPELKKKMFTQRNNLILLIGVLCIFVNGLFSLIFVGAWLLINLPHMLQYYQDSKRPVKKEETGQEVIKHDEPNS